MLPVDIHGMHKDTAQATIQHSTMWNNIKVLNLCQIMRVMVMTMSDFHTFSQWLLDIGHRETTSPQHSPDFLRVPNMCCQMESELIECIYESMRDRHSIPHPDFLRQSNPCSSKC